MTQTGRSEAVVALQLFEDAFAYRSAPATMTDSKQLFDAEYAEVMSFQGLAWQDVSFDLVEQCADAVFWFAPEAFCYYLPGLLAAGLRENRWDSNAYDALISCLDRSPEPDYWDDFFRPRWTRLTAPEIDAVAAWVRWLAIVAPDVARGNTYERAQDTLTLLKWTAEETE